jgi:hypothetical protein
MGLQKKKKKKIGIKYCGGCNPAYERVKIIDRLQSRLKDQILFLRNDQKGLDVLVLINGCPRSCAIENSNDKEIPCHSIAGENDFEILIDWLRSLDII